MNYFSRAASPLLLTAIALAACVPGEPPQSRPPPQVSVANPLAAQVTDWDEFTGRLEAVESVEIRARVDGYLQSVNFDEGSIVEKGDLLFVIDPRPYVASLNQAEAELTRAKVRLQLASNDLQRAQRLHTSRSISEEELDSRTQDRAAAAAALEAAQAGVESARLNVEFTEVKSPIRGRIGRALVTDGNLVNGGSAGATLLTTVVSLDPIHFLFTGNEQIYLHYLRLNQAGSRPSSHGAENPVRLRISDETAYTHEGVMDFVDNRVDEATGTVQGRAVFPNPDHLLVPGMFAEIQLIGEGPYEALLIPDEAIGIDQAQQFVYVLDDDDIARRRTIETGRLEGELRIVRSGLSSEDRVVVNGIQRVRAGAPVNPEMVTLKADNSPQANGDSQ